METRNAQTILNEVMAAALVAPEFCPFEALHDTAEYKAADRANDAKRMIDLESAITTPTHITFKTGARSSHKVRNIRARLEKFAGIVRTGAKLFGGGLDKPARKPTPAVIWPAGKVKLLSEMFEDKQYTDALAMGEDELGAVFYSYDAGIYDNGSRVFMAWAPMEVDGMPEGFASVKTSDGYFRVIHALSGRSVGNGTKARNSAIFSAIESWNTMSEEKQAQALVNANARLNNCELSRAAWVEFHQIDDARAIQARITEREQMDAEREALRASRRHGYDEALVAGKLRQAQAAQDVAQVVASAQAMAAIEQASESSALQELASDTSTEQAASQADDLPELATVCEQAQQASQHAPGSPGGNMGHAGTVNTSSARQVASSARAQAITSKSGAWYASFFAGDDGRPCLIFNGGQVLGFETGAERMRALQTMARQADAAAATGARWWHTATPAQRQAILLAGGFSSDGARLTANSNLSSYGPMARAELLQAIEKGLMTSQAQDQAGAVLNSENPQDQAQALKDEDPEKLTFEQLRSIGFALMSDVDADSLSMATIQRWTPAMFAGAVEYLDDINYHSEALFLECMRAGRDDLAAVIAHLVRYQRAPEYQGLTSDYCEARRVVAMTLNGQAIERVSPEAAAVLAGWGFDSAPVLKSETPQDQSPEFERVKPFNCDPVAMLDQGIKPDQLVGMGVNYTGNMANPDGEGAITSVSDTRGERMGGLRLMVLLEDGRQIIADPHYFTATLRPILQFNGKMHGAPYLAQLAATVATVRAQASAAKEEAAQAHARALVDLVSQYPQLQRAGTTYAGGKLAAVNMRTLLKMTFPGQKFSVTSDYNSARICWTDGPTDAEINAIIGRFDIGASDYQTDYFYTVRTAWSDLFGGVQYLTTSRHTSDDLVSRALGELYPESAGRPTVQDYQNGTGVFDYYSRGDAMRMRMREQLATMSTYQAPAPKTRARA